MKRFIYNLRPIDFLIPEDKRLLVRSKNKMANVGRKIVNIGFVSLNYKEDEIEEIVKANQLSLRSLSFCFGLD